MPVRNVHGDSDAKEIAKKLAQQHPNLLGPSMVSSEQLERLADKFIQHKKMLEIKRKQEHEAQVRKALMDDDSDDDPEPVVRHDLKQPLSRGRGPDSGTTSAFRRQTCDSDAHLASTAPPSRHTPQFQEDDALASLVPQRKAPSALAQPEDDALSSLLSRPAPSSRLTPCGRLPLASLDTTNEGLGGKSCEASLVTSSARTSSYSMTSAGASGATHPGGGRASRELGASEPLSPPTQLPSLKSELPSLRKAGLPALGTASSGAQSLAERSPKLVRREASSDSLELEEIGEEPRVPLHQTAEEGEDLNKVGLCSEKPLLRSSGMSARASLPSIHLR